MSLTDSFPYVEGRSSNESDEHIRLKGLAVYWLLCRGFDLDSIVEEYSYPKSDDPGQGEFAFTDVYAEEDDRRVYIECERNYSNPRSLSMGGLVPARDGERVYVFKRDGIFRVVIKEVTLTGPSGEITTNKPRLERVSDLPMVDLRAFSSKVEWL